MQKIQVSLFLYDQFWTWMNLFNRYLVFGSLVALYQDLCHWQHLFYDSVEVIKERCINWSLIWLGWNYHYDRFLKYFVIINFRQYFCKPYFKIRCFGNRNSSKAIILAARGESTTKVIHLHFIVNEVTL